MPVEPSLLELVAVEEQSSLASRSRFNFPFELLDFDDFELVLNFFFPDFGRLELELVSLSDLLVEPSLEEESSLASRSRFNLPFELLDFDDLELDFDDFELVLNFFFPDFGRLELELVSLSDLPVKPSLEEESSLASRPLFNLPFALLDFDDFVLVLDFVFPDFGRLEIEGSLLDFFVDDDFVLLNGDDDEDSFGAASLDGVDFVVLDEDFFDADDEDSVDTASLVDADFVVLDDVVPTSLVVEFSPHSEEALQNSNGLCDRISDAKLVSIRTVRGVSTAAPALVGATMPEDSKFESIPATAALSTLPEVVGTLRQPN
jgi:hypothetical protein